MLRSVASLRVCASCFAFAASSADSRMNGTKSCATHGSDRKRQRIADDKMGRLSMTGGVYDTPQHHTIYDGFPRRIPVSPGKRGYRRSGIQREGGPRGLVRFGDKPGPTQVLRVELSQNLRGYLQQPKTKRQTSVVLEGHRLKRGRNLFGLPVPLLFQQSARALREQR